MDLEQPLPAIDEPVALVYIAAATWGTIKARRILDVPAAPIG